MSERIPPNNREAEEAILGAMMMSKKTVTKDFGMATRRGCRIEHSAINNIKHPIFSRQCEIEKKLTGTRVRGTHHI